jgi:DNA-directed RNA polymerase subunit RPC12/RpoP
MPIRFLCARCTKRLTVPDQYAGRKAKCPSCGGPIMVPAAEAAAAPAAVAAANPWDLDEGNPGVAAPSEATTAASGRPAILGDRESYRAAALGLAGIWWSVALNMFVYFVLAGTVALQALLALIGEPTALVKSIGPYPVLFVALFLGALMLLGVVLRLIGCARLMAIPMAKLLAILVFLCELTAAAFLVIAGWAYYNGNSYSSSLVYDLEDAAAASGLRMVLAYLAVFAAGAASLVGVVFLLIFLARLGSLLGDKSVGQRIMVFLIFLVGGIIAMVVLFVGSFMVAFSARSGGEGMVSVATFVLTAMQIAILAVPLIIGMSFLNLLSTADTAIRRAGVWGSRS